MKDRETREFLKIEYQWVFVKTWNTLYSICIIGGPKGRKGQWKIFEEMMTENFQNLIKMINSQIQEYQWTPSTRNREKTTQSHIAIELLKTSYKEKCKSSQKKTVLYREE